MPYSLRLRPTPGATELVITFEAADQKIDRRDPDRAGFGEEFLGKRGYAVLSVLTKSANWFRPAGLEELFYDAEAQEFFEGYARIHSYGSSMGGFGALAFAEALGVSNVIALQPISTLAADLVPWEHRFAPGRALDWQGGRRDACDGLGGVETIHILFDPLSLDARHADRLIRAGGERVRQIPVPGAGHAVPHYLLERGILGSVISGCLEGASLDKLHRLTSKGLSEFREGS